MKKLILASQSPARAQLLRQAGYSFTVQPSSYEEDMTLDMPPRELAMFLSEGKARDIASKVQEDAVIISADTFVISDGKLLGKPNTVANARSMLQCLRNTRHEVLTGWCVIDSASNKKHREVSSCAVTLRDITDTEIESYIKTGEPLEKAGAYALTMKAAIFASRIDGDFYAIIGLPLVRVSTVLAEFEIEPEWIKNKR